jgi:hypothetical protein
VGTKCLENIAIQVWDNKRFHSLYIIRDKIPKISILRIGKQKYSSKAGQFGENSDITSRERDKNKKTGIYILGK